MEGVVQKIQFFSHHSKIFSRGQNFLKFPYLIPFLLGKTVGEETGIASHFGRLRRKPTGVGLSSSYSVVSGVPPKLNRNKKGLDGGPEVN